MTSVASGVKRREGKNKMVGRTRTSDVKSRLGKRGVSGAKAKSGGVRDARDVLRKKVIAKGRPTQVGNANTRARIQRLMPLADLITTKKKTITYEGTSPKDKLRTMSLTSGSLRVTTKQPELCRKTIVSPNSLKVVTPTKSIIGKKETSTLDSTPTRTLTNDLYTRERRLPLVSTLDEDLRTSSPSLSFTRPAEERSILRSSLGRARQDPIPIQHDHKNLTKIVVTNLHPRVVQEDIAELFGAVGPLLGVKLDSCVAEVNFAKADHADMAYQKYHNRMLDGQAMKCTLGLANTPVASTAVETSKEDERLSYSGAELVYPKTPSRPVVFQVRI